MNTKREILMKVYGYKLWRLSEYKIIDRWLYVTIHADNNVNVEDELEEWIGGDLLCSETNSYKKEVIIIQNDGDKYHFFGMWPMVIRIPLNYIKGKTTCTFTFDYWELN